MSKSSATHFGKTNRAKGNKHIGKFIVYIAIMNKRRINLMQFRIFKRNLIIMNPSLLLCVFFWIYVYNLILCFENCIKIFNAFFFLIEFQSMVFVFYDCTYYHRP